MKCPQCEIKLKTISVFDRGHEVFREKRCPVCRDRVITIERLTDANSIPDTIRKPGGKK